MALKDSRISHPPTHLQRGSTSSVLEAPSKSLGLPLILLIIYVVMDYARPADPMDIPFLISIILFISWLLLKKKLWTPQIVCFFLLLATIAAMGPFAINTFAIWWGFRAMAVQLLCICIPMIHHINSPRKTRIFIYALISVFAYLAVYGLLHAGTGPGGFVGDENDLALALNTAIPFAYVSFLLSRRLLNKALFGASTLLIILAVVATFSRGGFLGLIPVLLYCYLLSPNKVFTTIVAACVALALSAVTPEKYGMSYSQRLSSMVAETTGEQEGTGALRKQHWAIARRMFYDNPILGVGFKNYNWNIPSYQTEQQYETLGRSLAGFAAHSLYFTVLAELGAAGVLIFAAILWYNYKDIRWIIRHAGTITASRKYPSNSKNRLMKQAPFDDMTYARYYAHAICAAFLGYLVSGIFLSVFDYPHFWFLTALLGGLKQTTASLPNPPLVQLEASGEI